MYRTRRCNTVCTLRVTPVDVNELGEERSRQGFEEFSFDFSEHGGWIGGSCLVIFELPDYAVLSIWTGQNMPGGGQMWEGGFAFDE